MSKDRLFTSDFCLILGANFLLYFAFYLILPVLPFFLKEEFAAPNGLIGVVLSCYTIAALSVRPFSGYMLDMFARKPIYLLTFAVFTVTFGGYLVAVSIAMVMFVRVIHGLSFGMVTVAGNTIVIDIMPSSRRGEGLGYYGLVNNMAMAFGPMAGLFLHSYYPFSTIFICSLASGFCGLILATLVKTPRKQRVERVPVSLDRFFLVKGIPAGVALLLFSVPYGITMSFVAMYMQDMGLTVSSGLFFTFMAFGLMISRIFSGRLVDKGYIPEVIRAGMSVVCVCYFVLALCDFTAARSIGAANVLILVTAFLLGSGCGTIFPAYNTLFVNLAPNNRRGTAVSTYLTSWDVGIGLGLLVGGYISQFYSFSSSYVFGGALCVISTVLFVAYVGPHFMRHKLR